jgi:hypothetical protein
MFKPRRASDTDHAEEREPVLKATKHDADKLDSTARLRQLQVAADKLRQAVDEHFARLNALSQANAEPDTKHRRLVP